MKEKLKLIHFVSDSSKIAKLTEEILDKYDDHSSIYYTGGYLRKIENYFKRVNRSEHVKSGNEFNNISEKGGENCFIPSEKGCFLKCTNQIFKMNFTKKIDFTHSYKRKTNVITRCTILALCERYRIDIVLNDVKTKRKLPRSVNQKEFIIIH